MCLVPSVALGPSHWALGKLLQFGSLRGMPTDLPWKLFIPYGPESTTVMYSTMPTTSIQLFCTNPSGIWLLFALLMQLCSTADSRLLDESISLREP